MVSTPEAISKNVSNKPFTLQKPVGLMGDHPQALERATGTGTR